MVRKSNVDISYSDHFSPNRFKTYTGGVLDTNSYLYESPSGARILFDAPQGAARAYRDERIDALVLTHAILTTWPMPRRSSPVMAAPRTAMRRPCPWSPTGISSAGGASSWRSSRLRRRICWRSALWSRWRGWRCRRFMCRGTAGQPLFLLPGGRRAGRRRRSFLRRSRPLGSAGRKRGSAFSGNQIEALSLFLTA